MRISDWSSDVCSSDLPTRLKIAAGVVVVVALAAIFFWFAPRAGTQNVPADHVTISPVTKGTFDDFIPLRARVTPLVTVYLDAVEGGRVEKVMVEDGASVTEGQMLAVLSNPDTALNLLARQTERSEEHTSELQSLMRLSYAV